MNHSLSSLTAGSPDMSLADVVDTNMTSFEDNLVLNEALQMIVTDTNDTSSAPMEEVVGIFEECSEENVGPETVITKNEPQRSMGPTEAFVSEADIEAVTFVKYCIVIKGDFVKYY